MTRQLKTLEGEATAPATDWVNEMKSYFQETGTYRAEDVQRVLGKPGESFEGKPTPDTQFKFIPRK